MDQHCDEHRDDTAEREEVRKRIASFMITIDRNRPHGEAQFAILEGALHLLGLDDPHLTPRCWSAKLQEALGAVRAAVVAVAYALVQSRTADPAGRRPGRH